MSHVQHIVHPIKYTYLGVDSKHIASVPDFFHQLVEIPLVFRADCLDASLIENYEIMKKPSTHLLGTTLSS